MAGLLQGHVAAVTGGGSGIGQGICQAYAREGASVIVLAGGKASAVKLDVTDRQALDFIDERMKRLGVGRALARAGAQAGDVVHIGEFSFEYEPDG